MVSFGCYDNSDFIATRIITNFHLYLNKYNCGGNFSKCLFMVSQSMLKKTFTGIDPEKLYRATFICQYGLCCCIVWPSFLFDCFVKIWATCKSFLDKWFTAPPGKKLPVRLCLCVKVIRGRGSSIIRRNIRNILKEILIVSRQEYYLAARILRSSFRAFTQS